jgi:hypothetical protein
MRSPACPVLATALVASIADPKAFRSGRNFSAWISCPLWAKSRHLQCKTACPLFPR